MSVEFKDDAVCFANGRYWSPLGDGYRYLVDDKAIGIDFKYLIKCPDFKLNTIKQGDYIEESELDTEQKYNAAVEVFGLFGFEFGLDATDTYSDFIKNAGAIKGYELNYLSVCDDGLFHTDETHAKRKVTYNQLMAIGELKRLEIKRDNKPQLGKNEDGSMKLVKSNFSEKPNSSDAVNKPSHYQFFEGVEVIEIIASSMTHEQFKGYCLGNRIKYRLRAGNKDKLEQEIAKSDKYVELYDEHKHLCK